MKSGNSWKSLLYDSQLVRQVTSPANDEIDQSTFRLRKEKMS